MKNKGSVCIEEDLHKYVNNLWKNIKEGEKIKSTKLYDTSIFKEIVKNIEDIFSGSIKADCSINIPSEDITIKIFYGGRYQLISERGESCIYLKPDRFKE